MDLPDVRKMLLYQTPINPGSCFSCRVQQERADSPGPSCVSMKSDQSMDPLVYFKDQSFEKRSGFIRGSSCVSLGSAKSMDQLFPFNNQSIETR